MNHRNLFYTHIKGKPVKRVVRAEKVKSSHGFAAICTLDCGHVKRLPGSEYSVGSRVCCEECKP